VLQTLETGRSDGHGKEAKRSSKNNSVFPIAIRPHPLPLSRPVNGYGGGRIAVRRWRYLSSTLRSIAEYASPFMVIGLRMSAQL
jgi:hypothetical protein